MLSMPVVMVVLVFFVVGVCHGDDSTLDTVIIHRTAER